MDVVFFSDLFPCRTYMLNHEMTLSPYHVLLNYNISVLGRGHMEAYRQFYWGFELQSWHGVYVRRYPEEDN